MGGRYFSYLRKLQPCGDVERLPSITEKRLTYIRRAGCFTDDSTEQLLEDRFRKKRRPLELALRLPYQDPGFIPLRESAPAPHQNKALPKHQPKQSKRIQVLKPPQCKWVSLLQN